MTTAQRIEAVQQVLSKMQTDRQLLYYPDHIETSTEKALVQLLLICRNQQEEIETLKGQMRATMDIEKGRWKGMYEELKKNTTDKL